MSSSLETDSSQGGDTPLFQYTTGNGGSSTSASNNTAFPFNPPFMVPQRKDSTTSSSGPDTPESMEIRKLKQTSRGLAATSHNLHNRSHRDSDQLHHASISIPRYAIIDDILATFLQC